MAGKIPRFALVHRAERGNCVRLEDSDGGISAWSDDAAVPVAQQERGNRQSHVFSYDTFARSGSRAFGLAPSKPWGLLPTTCSSAQRRSASRRATGSSTS